MFEKSNYASIDTSHLQWYRFLLLSPSIMMTFNSVQTNEPIWFFYYLTHWGVNVTAFSLIATMIAARKQCWQTTAMISTQCATALNLLIMVLFWCILAPYIFPNLGWSGHDLYMRWHMITLHLIPFLQTTFNTMLTDMELVEKDWRMMIPMGCLYMFANALGKLDCGVAIYPVLDWVHPVFTFCGWFAVACIMSALYYYWAIGVRKWRACKFGVASRLWTLCSMTYANS